MPLENKLFENKYVKIVLEDGVPHVYQSTGGVVIIPVFDGKLLLIKIERHGKFSLEFPRGFQEQSDGDAIAAAKRELVEELGVSLDQIVDATVLGQNEPDTGLISSDIHVVRVELQNGRKFVLQKTEGISDYRLLTVQQVEERIRQRGISDGFTLGAMAMYTADSYCDTSR